MRRLNITGKIWLSIGVFVLGYALSVTLGQVQGFSNETTLTNTTDAVFPAGQRSQETEAAFQRTVKGFSDAVLMQDASGLDRAAEEGRQVTEGLKAIASIRGLAPERLAEANRLSASVSQLITDARAAYGVVLSNPAGMTPETQSKMQELAARTDALRTGLQNQKEQFSKDLHNQLNGVRANSAQQRWIALAVFGLSLLLAAVVVNLTIQRAIAGPISQVVQGVQKATEAAVEASEKMMQSGQVVARDAQDQAASVQETSASLEEISATTRENAARAGEADTLMREAKQTVDRAATAMTDLAHSMDAISNSSKQVAGVLKSIDDIAFHTNILALNAAVEAARAGSAGAGFSVVADEVRSLAQRAAEASRHSGEIVEKTIADVNKGVHLVSAAHGAFSEVSAKIANGSQVVTQIAASSEEQARGVGHIDEAISRIEKVTQRNAANSQETAEAAASMTEQMQTTREHLSELAAVIGLNR